MSTEEKPVFEFAHKDADWATAVRIYANGRVEGAGEDIVVVNRLPQFELAAAVRAHPKPNVLRVELNGDFCDHEMNPMELAAILGALPIPKDVLAQSLIDFSESMTAIKKVVDDNAAVMFRIVIDAAGWRLRGELPPVSTRQIMGIPEEAAPSPEVEVSA